MPAVRASPTHRVAHHVRLEAVLEGQHDAREQCIAPEPHQRDEQVRGVHINSRRPVPLTTSNLQAAKEEGAAVTPGVKQPDGKSYIPLHSHYTALTRVTYVDTTKCFSSHDQLFHPKQLNVPHHHKLQQLQPATADDHARRAAPASVTSTGGLLTESVYCCCCCCC
jgi:hypothetical protein